jgi:hypothetical protein
MVAPTLLVAGCGHREDEVPRPGLGPDLREVAKTRGKRLEYKAEHAGKLYLYDYDTGDFLVSVPVNAGDTFVLEPASNRAMLGKQPVDLDNPANAFDDYRLYLADDK